MPTSTPPPANSQNATSNDPLYAPIGRGPTELRTFLKTAVRATAALAELHGKDVIHRNIRRTHVVIHAESGDVRLIGLRDSYAATEAQRGSDPSETLPYTSPEQTEGMKRPVDHRADLYSLGITLYEHLTGALPFQADDPLGWIQAHLTKAPRDPREALPGTPDVVADILLKLMNKTVEERYQSARGLLIDLETCLVELEAKGRIEAFPLGARDVWHGLRISAKLYGREKESAELLAAFDRVLTTGSREIALVSGYSGVGKSSLVQEMHKPIVRERGFFLAGKFDQHKRNIPYVTISQAFREVVKQILGESEAAIQGWKERMLEALGPNGQLIIDVIPQVEQVIGKQPPVAPLPIGDAQNRFNNVFRNFIGLFAKKEHPLALFLDDLQYADFASLRLIHYLLARTDTRHFFVLGAYRDNEVSASHPFMMTLEEMRKENVRITSLVLKPLDLDDLTHLVADTFHCDNDRAQPLAKLLHNKTGGNPFFANQFLAELHHENLVQFDVDKALWHWSTADIEAKQFTDDVVELMADKLRRLPGETQAALQLAACIGSEFDVEMLEMTHDKTPEETYQDLDHAVRAEFMLRKGNTYKFLHDRVHQAAYSLIPEEQRSWVHLRVGRLLLERTADADRDERSFDIVNQFNIGQAYVNDPDEKRAVTNLNLVAGRKAKASVAFQSATTYLNAGIAMLDGDCWSSQYATTYRLHFDLAECEYALGNLDAADKLLSTILAQSTVKVDRAAAYRIRIQICTTKMDIVTGMGAGLECLTMLGINLSFQPDPAAAQADFDSLMDTLKAREVEDLLNLPSMTDPEIIEAVGTLADVHLTAYFVSQDLYQQMLCKMVELSITHGNTGASTVGYGSFGSLLCAKHKYSYGYRFGKLAYDLVQKTEFLAYRAQVCNIFASLVSFWTRHIRENIDYLKHGLQAAFETGNVNYGCFNALQISTVLILMGAPLERVERSTVEAIDLATSGKSGLVVAAVTGLQRFAHCMMGRTTSLLSFDGPGFDAKAFEQQMIQMGIPVLIFWYFVFKLQAQVIAGDYEGAVATAEIAKGAVAGATTQPPVPDFYFLSGLAAASHLTTVAADKQADYRQTVTVAEEKLRMWAESCADNFVGKHLLLCAEIARLDGKLEESSSLYEKAIEALHTSGFIHYEAVAHELAARLCTQDGRVAAAHAHTDSARARYSEWGATAKVSTLQ